MPIILALMLLIGGGTSFAAESAVPGDLLYPVKVGFNEEVRAAVALSPEAKLEWEARRAERRVEEASRLAGEGRLDETRKAELDLRIKLHADRLEAKLKELEPKDAERAADLASKFEVALKVHGRIFADVALGATTSATTTEALKARIRGVVEHMMNARRHAEGEIDKSHPDKTRPDVKTAAEGKIKAAENMIAAARRVVEAKKEQLGAEAVASAEAKLKVADDLVVQAKAKVVAEAYKDAFRLAGEAARTAHEVRFTIEMRGRLKVDFRGQGSTTATSTNSIQGAASTSTSTDVDAQSTVDAEGIDAQGTLDLDLGF